MNSANELAVAFGIYHGIRRVPTAHKGLRPRLFAMDPSLTYIRKRAHTCQAQGYVPAASKIRLRFRIYMLKRVNLFPSNMLRRLNAEGLGNSR